ncbi:MAG: sugar ABC transporter ATP-binding protein [Sulfobacillus acidophilus]|uniref:Sugar ABC transporter ATP-binding protein n=1 Tax=Sulfobacillus acidophilus TaxID=53633 RepID=A0A2T2WDC9_9FIRM|nr:MAG: sugar ABC transporter ATP-binding protein [Sulfobacillus acidophilus]
MTTHVQTATPLLSVRGLSKSFGNVQAVDNVSLDIFPKEVIGLVGDNGAGKSTFLSLLSGYNIKDSGQFFFRGKEVEVTSPRTSRRELGIEMIYQNLSLAPDLTVWENIFLGEELARWRLFMRRRDMIAQAERVLRQLNSKVSANDFVGNLSGGEQQLVAISRALLFERDLIIMDEPTAAISLAKVRDVLDLILSLKQHGKSVIIVSHRLEDILTVADRIVVFARGRIREILENKDLTIESLVRAIFGDLEGGAK